RASRSKTFQIIERRLMPIDVYASTTPESTSNNADSINRAIYGDVYTTRGTITPFTPITVPAIAFVNGKIKNSNIINGMERIMLTKIFNMKYTTLFENKKFGRVITSNTPSVTPIMTEKNNDMIVICNVSTIVSPMTGVHFSLNSLISSIIGYDSTPQLRRLLLLNNKVHRYSLYGYLLYEQRCFQQY